MKTYGQKYRIGDVVMIADEMPMSMRHFAHGVEAVVRNVERFRGGFEYITTKGGWYDEEQLTLVRHADKQSMKILDRDFEEEDEE